MKVKTVFISNYFNHHQKYLCDALYKESEGSFFFIETIPMPEARKQLGYSITVFPSYVIHGYQQEEEKKIYELVECADCVIWGSANVKYLTKRLKQNKLTFIYSERIFKQGLKYTRWLKYALSCYYTKGRYSNLYLLCAGAYSYYDYYRLFSFRKRAFTWGYFPETVCYKDIDKLMELKHPASILWVGRLIELKHPEYPILVASKLKKYKMKFKMKVIGIGEKEEEIRSMIEKEELTEYIELLGAMTPSEVRHYMEQSEIFLFTSDKNEGWGAVLNEAMNSLCAVVANYEIGAVPYLISNRENGLVYNNNNIDELIEKVLYLLNNNTDRIQIGKNAYRTITEKWNSEIAAKRLITTINYYMKNGSIDFLYNEGVMSAPSVIRDSN